MTLTFNLKNKKFEDELSVSIGNETKKLSKECAEVSFDIADETQAVVCVSFINNSSKSNEKITFWKILILILLSPLLLLISLFNFFATNYDGIKVCNFFKEENPFRLKKTFTINTSESTSPISIEFVHAKYIKHKKSYSKPDILLHNADVSEITEEISYDRKSMKISFALFHYPAYFVIFAFIVAIIVLIIIGIIGVTQDFSDNGALRVLGLSFCFAVMIFLLGAMITCLVKTVKLYKEIDCTLTAEYNTENYE